MSYKTKCSSCGAGCSSCGAGGLIVTEATLMATGQKMTLRSVLHEDGFTFDLPDGIKDGSTTDEKVVCVVCHKTFDLMGNEMQEEDKEREFIFSIKVKAKNQAEAIAKFQDENINPADMDIEELIEEPNSEGVRVKDFIKLLQKFDPELLMGYGNATGHYNKCPHEIDMQQLLSVNAKLPKISEEQHLVLWFEE